MGKKGFDQIKSFEVKKACRADIINNVKEFEMKRFVLVVTSCIFVVALTGRYSFAQTDSGMKGEQKGEMKQQGMKMDEGMMKQMMEKCQPMMKQMMGDGMMKKEMMQKMMSMHMDRMGMDDSQSKLKRAEQWLKKAVDLHELHMDDPTTTTDASQMELMDQIKKAYGCITGTGPDMSGTQSQEVEGKEPKKAEPSKTDSHKH